jgi:hypothetical protein
VDGGARQGAEHHARDLSLVLRQSLHEPRGPGNHRLGLAHELEHEVAIEVSNLSPVLLPSGILEAIEQGESWLGRAIGTAE